MRRKEKQVSDITVINNVIKNAIVCRMALVKDNLPYIVPLNFGYDGKNLYFHSSTSGEKVEILQKNNNVCIEFEQDVSIVEREKPCQWGARYITVIVHGTAELVDNLEQKAYGLQQILAQYKAGTGYSFTDEELKSVLVYKVTPREIVAKSS